ncbi:MAG: 2-hydroxy-3-oxopropionate reductase [Acidobacteria bacterium]|nr:2-hydroxy-3-oxopropionate reductase [Acidobacteriota bacterium]|tara:strand:+ start:2375 stop:3271 length:897 start_codon:yes stop_codon:yes gene_type:complete
MQLGFIGLGTMGRPMALNLMRGGHAMAVWSRRAESAAPLVAEGATGVETPAALGALSDVVFTMVTSTEDVRGVVLGEDGLRAGLRSGSLVIDMSTIDPGVTREIASSLADIGVDMLDAPVSGGPKGAQDATLAIMVGGPAGALERARPLFASLGPTVMHLGDHGAGQTTKLCHQLALLVNAQGAAEALNLASQCGLDVEQVRQVMMAGMASSRVLDAFGAKMAARDFEAGIESRLYHKDMHLALGLAHAQGAAAPAAAVTMQLINGLAGRDWGRRDLAALVGLIAELGQSPGDTSNDG